MKVLCKTPRARACKHSLRYPLRWWTLKTFGQSGEQLCLAQLALSTQIFSGMSGAYAFFSCCLTSLLSLSFAIRS